MLRQPGCMVRNFIHNPSEFCIGAYGRYDYYDCSADYNYDYNYDYNDNYNDNYKYYEYYEYNYYDCSNNYDYDYDYDYDKYYEYDYYDCLCNSADYDDDRSCRGDNASPDNNCS